MAPESGLYRIAPSPPSTFSHAKSISSTSSAPESSTEVSDVDSTTSSSHFDLAQSTSHLSRAFNYKELAVLQGHTAPVSSLALCGEFILTASEGKDMIVWQQPFLNVFSRFGQGDGAIKSIVTAGSKIFSAHQDSKIRAWKISRKEENAFKFIGNLPTTKNYFQKFMNQSNYVAFRRHQKKLWIEHVDAVSCLSVSDGLLYSGSWDKTIKVWRISDLKCLESIQAHNDAINALVACKGAVYSASADGKIKVWGNERKGSSTKHCLKGILEGHKGVSVNSVAVSDDGRWVYGGRSNGSVLGWEGSGDHMQWNLVSDTKAHAKAVLCLCVKGEILCSGSADGSIGVWRREEYGKLSKMGEMVGHKGPVKCLQASPNNVCNGFLLYSGAFDKSLRVWWVPITVWQTKFIDHVV